MMPDVEKISVKILEPKARRLLEDLENMHLIEIEKPGANDVPKRRFGSMKGFVTYISEDFDAPMDDLKDYM